VLRDFFADARGCSGDKDSFSHAGDASPVEDTMRHWMFRPRAGTGGIFNSRESGGPPVALACNGGNPCYTLCPVQFGAISRVPEHE
jgi:hypothetical protein